MHDWLTHLLGATRAGQCLTLPDRPLPGQGVALALAPHPDDPDAVAVTLRRLADGGWSVWWLVLATGWSGVQDAFVDADPVAKGQARETEQRTSAGVFGLPAERLIFLRLPETAEGLLVDDLDNQARVQAALTALAPDLALLPYWDDHHPDHRLVARWFQNWARAQARPVVALYNEDPKSRDFRPALQVRFGAETAAWKAAVLECHRSQSERNQAVRGITFAERILGMNRDEDGYAERFAVERYRGEGRK